MNSLFIVLIASGLFFWAYRFYARKLERLWTIEPNRATPAYSKYDSVDYIPAKNWLVLFGHHFASIAGAGPIIGPVIAVMLWGWLPALLWVVLGTIFIGGVHDFGALITSVREGGSSIADIAQHAISRRAKIIFSLFVWLALILVIGVYLITRSALLIMTLPPKALQTNRTDITSPQPTQARCPDVKYSFLSIRREANRDVFSIILLPL